MSVKHFDGREAVEKELAGTEVIAYRADIVDVAARVEWLAARGLFRRHEGGGPGEGTLQRELDPIAVQAEAFHEAEIEQLGHVVDLAAFAGQNVARLDIAMDEADAVGLAQCLTDLPQQVYGP